MNRKEAVNLIKEITDEKCTNLTGHDIILKPTNAKLSDEFELQIKTKIDKDSIRCLETIVEHNGYVLSFPKQGMLIISSGNKIARNEGTGLM